jgi:hypothetical protein
MEVTTRRTAFPGTQFTRAKRKGRKTSPRLGRFRKKAEGEKRTSVTVSKYDPVNPANFPLDNRVETPETFPMHLAQ